MVIANLNLERELFRQLFLPDVEKRILTVRAESGFGKTFFLEHCLYKDLPGDVDKVSCQLKGGYVSVPEIFSRFVQDLQWDEATDFVRSLSDILDVSPISIDSNLLIGFRQQISVHLENFSPAERKYRLVALTDALFHELDAREQPVLVVFDTYDQAAEEVRSWISRAFLVRVVHSHQVYVLIAGQRVPDHAEGLEWSQYCNAHELYGIKDAVHWLPVIESLGRRLPTPTEGVNDPVSWFSGICHVLDGNPDDIRRVIEAKLPRRELQQ